MDHAALVEEIDDLRGQLARCREHLARYKAFVDEVEDRLNRAATSLTELRDGVAHRPEGVRLSGKIEGVKLAASYLADRKHLGED